MTQRIPVVERILSANEKLAEENKSRLEAANVFALNLMASPGAGKTSLIEQTLPRLTEKMRVAVVDGDIATSIDADRAAATAFQGGEPGFERKLALPDGISIVSVAPQPPEGDQNAPRRFMLYPGGTVPRIAIEIANARNARRTVRIDPITGVPQVEQGQ